MESDAEKSYREYYESRMPTLFPKLNHELEGGFFPGNYSVFTTNDCFKRNTMLYQMAATYALEEKNVLIFSKMSTKQQLINTLMFLIRAQFPCSSISKEDVLSHVFIYDDPEITINYIESTAESICSQNNIKFIILDSFNKIRPYSPEEEAEYLKHYEEYREPFLDYIAIETNRRLKQLAMNTDASVIALGKTDPRDWNSVYRFDSDFVLYFENIKGEKDSFQAIVDKNHVGPEQVTIQYRLNAFRCVEEIE